MPDQSRLSDVLRGPQRQPTSRFTLAINTFNLLLAAWAVFKRIQHRTVMRWPPTTINLWVVIVMGALAVAAFIWRRSRGDRQYTLMLLSLLTIMGWLFMIATS